jgi:hypothetical protein
MPTLIPSIPRFNKGNLYLNGLLTSFVSGTSISIGPGQARDHTNTNDIVLPNLVTINAAFNGANGLDEGVLADSTSYAVYVIGDSNENDWTLLAAVPQPIPNVQPPVTVVASTGGYFRPGAGLLSLSFTAPALPAPFDMYRRIGSVLTSGAGAILTFIPFGFGPSSVIEFTPGVVVLTAGDATAFTLVNVSAEVPPSASFAIVSAALTSDAGGARTATFRATGQTATMSMVSPASTVTTQTLTIPVTTTAGVTSFDYEVSNAAAALTLTVTGYVDSL